MAAIKLLVAFRMLMSDYNETRVADYSACRLTNRVVKQNYGINKKLMNRQNLEINSSTGIEFSVHMWDFKICEMNKRVLTSSR